MIDNLTIAQRLMLLELLVAMTKVDGSIATAEGEMLEGYAELMDLSLEDVSGDMSIAELAPYFDTPESQVTAIQELCRIARLDGDFAESEREAILDVAARMGMPAKLVGKIDEWVVEGMRWVERGDELVREAAALKS